MFDSSRVFYFDSQFRFFLSLILVGFSAFAGVAQPTILNVSPKSGKPGSVITIDGSGFNISPAGNIVRVGSIRATVLSSSATQIKAVVPAGAIYAQVTVSVNGNASKSEQFFTPTATGSTGTGIGNGQFSLHHSQPISDTAFWMQAADLDGDGKSDLVASHNYPGAISIWRNAGTGPQISFSLQGTQATGGSGIVLELEDVDADGLAEILFTNAGLNQLGVMRNISQPGTINFAAPVYFTTEAVPFDLNIADYDLDGKLDIAVSHNNSNNLLIFLNKGTGGSLAFQPQVISAAIKQSTIATADFNGDRKPDVVVGGINSEGRVLINNSSGGVMAFDASKIPSVYMAWESGVADVNGDNKLDVVQSWGSGAFILINTNSGGAPSFAPEYVSTPAMGFLAIADLNFDTRPDFLATGTSGSFLPLVENGYGRGGSFNFNAGNAALAKKAESMAIGDFDADGDVDVVAGVNADSIQIYTNAQKRVGIVSFSPQSAGRGKPVQVITQNVELISQVSFGNIPADSFRIENSYSLTAYPGSGASGAIMVVGEGDTASLNGFIHIPKPEITRIVPDTAIWGSSVIVYGRNMGYPPTISFGGMAPRSWTYLSDTSFQFFIDTVQSGAVTITTEGGTGTLPGFVYIPQPYIFSFTGDAIPGDSMDISGQGFIGVKSISIGNHPITSFTVTGSERIRLKLPAMPIGGELKLQARGGAAASAGFYNGFDSITLSPSNPAIGEVVTITVHKGLPGGLPGDVLVWFNESPAQIVSIHGNSIRAVVPATQAFPKVRIAALGISRWVNHPVRLRFGNAADTLHAQFFDEPIRLRSDSATGPTSIAIADIDGDMVADVLQLSGSPRNQLVIHQNRSYPGRFALTPHFFEPPVEPDGSIQPIIADINGDGKQEILMADKLGRTVYYENQSTPGNISLAWKGVLFRLAARIVSDFDADGRLDLLSIAGVSKDSIVIAKNISLDGNLAFEEQRFTYYVPPISVVDIKASDLNGDNRPDLVIQSNYLHKDIAILFRNTSMPGQISWDYSTPSLNKCTLTPIYFGDVNADGRTDLLYVDCTVTYPVYSFGKLSVQINRSAPGGPIGFQKMQSNYDPSGMGEVTDLNGDGLPDFAFNDIFDAFSVVQLTNQSGNTPGFRLSCRYGTDSTMANRTTLLAGVDLDNDKRTDILLAAAAHATLRVFRNNGNDASQSGQCPSGSYQLSAATGKVKYQWELSVNDSAFTALTNNEDFDGTTTQILTVKTNVLTGPAHRYRCVADGIPQRIYTIQPEAVFTGNIDNKWSNPLNWKCQLLPNEHTAVIAEKNLLIDAPAKVKSIRALSGVDIRLATDITLEIVKPAGGE